MPAPGSTQLKLSCKEVLLADPQILLDRFAWLCKPRKETKGVFQLVFDQLLP